MCSLKIIYCDDIYLQSLMANSIINDEINAGTLQDSLWASSNVIKYSTK